MSMTLFFDFTVDKQNNTINIKREFAADRSTVWDCYTRSEILDKWWMPLPWKSRTKSMDFREGGKWHYAAVGPNGEEHWSITTYVKIEPQKLFLANDAFGDANGNINAVMPQSKWTMNFSDMGKVRIPSCMVSCNSPTWYSWNKLSQWDSKKVLLWQWRTWMQCWRSDNLGNQV